MWEHLRQRVVKGAATVARYAQHVQIVNRLASMPPDDAERALRMLLASMDDDSYSAFRPQVRPQQSTASEPAPPDLPSGGVGLGDDAKLDLYIRTNARLAAVLPRSVIGSATPDAVVELEAILATYERLLRAGPPSVAVFQPSDVQARLAETLEYLGTACETLLDGDQADGHFARAAALREALGQHEQAARDRAKIRRRTEIDRAATDAHMHRLLTSLDALPKGAAEDALPRAELLAELAELYLHTDELVEAERCLAEAEAAMTDAGRTDPAAGNVEEAVAAILEALDADRFDEVNVRFTSIAGQIELYRRIYAGRAQIARQRGASGTNVDRNQALIERSNGALRALHVVAERLYGNLQALQAEIAQQAAALTGTPAVGEASPATEPAPLPDPHASVIDVTDALQRLSVDRRRARAEGRAPTALLPVAERLVADARRHGDRQLIALALLRQAALLTDLERDDEAVAVLENARRELGDAREHDLQVDIFGRLASINAGRGRWRTVSTICAQGIALAERYRGNVSAQYAQSSYLQSRVGLYAHGVRAAYELGDADLMLRRAELFKARGLLRARPAERGAGATGGPPQRMADFLEVSAAVDDLRRRLDSLDTQPPALAPPHPEVGTQRAALREELQALLFRRRMLWDLLTIERVRDTTAAGSPDFSLEAAQAALDPDEAVLSYYWLDRTTLLIAAIDRERIKVVLQDLSAERDALDAYAARVLAYVRAGGEFLDGDLQGFAPLLLPEAVGTILTGKRRLLISPHRRLHALPFHALRWGGGYLIEQIAVSYVPNLSSLLLRYEPAGEGVLGLWVQDFAVRTADGRALQPLPSTRKEVEALPAAWAAAGVAVTVLPGPEVDEARLHDLATSGALARFRYLHLATHGDSVASDAPMESVLYLGTSRLDGLEIANWRLNADVVVLSACCSGQRATRRRDARSAAPTTWSAAAGETDELPGDEVFGLQAALFMAGARRVVGTLWPLDGNDAVKIMPVFHRRMAAGDPPEVALQEAIKHYLAHSLFKGIARWGSLFMVALGRPARGESTGPEDG